jgi:hypothetical protein
MKPISKRSQILICSAIATIMTLLFVYLWRQHDKGLNSTVLYFVFPYWPVVILEIYEIKSIYFFLFTMLASIFVGWYLFSRVIMVLVFDRTKVRNMAFLIYLIAAIVLFTGGTIFYVLCEYCLD